MLSESEGCGGKNGSRGLNKLAGDLKVSVLGGESQGEIKTGELPHRYPIKPRVLKATKLTKKSEKNTLVPRKKDYEKKKRRIIKTASIELVCEGTGKKDVQ